MAFTAQGQTNYTVKLTQAVAGMWADDYEDLDVVSYKCTENMGFGVLVVLDTTNDPTGFSVMLPKLAGASLDVKAVGVTMYVATLAQNLAPAANIGFAAGMLIPVCRKGRMYGAMQNAGANAISPLASPNVWHPSDNSANNAQYRGFFTTDNTAAGVGSEIAAAPAGVRFIRDIATSGVCLLDILFPQTGS